MDKKEWYHGILQYLYDTYSLENPRPVVLNELLSDEFLLKMPDEIEDGIKVLNVLQTHRHIEWHYEDNDGNHIELPPWKVMNRMSGPAFSYFKIVASLTWSGYQYYESHLQNWNQEKREAQRFAFEIKQSESVIATNRMQRWSFWASLFTSLTAVCISVFSLFKDTPTIVKPVVLLKDTILKLQHTDTLPLKIQLDQLGDTSKEAF